jgi:transposase InsO family protein
VPIAPRTYYAHIGRPRSKRALWEVTVTELLADIYEPDQAGRRRPESLYGSVKTWAYLQRGGFPVARCTVERLMRANGWRGVTRARKVRTTVADPAAARAGDLVNRCFTTQRPDALWVADFTYVPLAGGGFGYTAFVIDAFAGYIPGWECSLSKETTFVASALRQAAGGHPVLFCHKIKILGWPLPARSPHDLYKRHPSLRCPPTSQTRTVLPGGGFTRIIVVGSMP